MAAPRPAPTLCKQKAHLWIEFRQAAKVYQAALAGFGQRLATVAKDDDYPILSDSLDEAKRLSEEARQELAAHISKHRCW
jgi:hypothetical protein